MTDKSSAHLRLAKGIDFRVHWLQVTVSCDIRAALYLADRCFSALVPDGGFISLPYGGFRRYKFSEEGLCKFKIYHHVSDVFDVLPALNEVHFVIPGAACDCISLDDFRAFFAELGEWQCNYKVTRLDVAFDGAGFSPRDCLEAAMLDWEGDGIMRCAAHRESMHLDMMPIGKKDNGERGSETFYIGSKHSTRMLRVYDKRGYTRVELQMRDEWATQSAVSIFAAVDGQACAVSAMGVLGDFIEFKTDWWRKFVNAIPRAMVRALAGSVTTTIRKKSEWLCKQVAPVLKALSIISPAHLPNLHGVKPNAILMRLYGGYQSRGVVGHERAMSKMPRGEREKQFLRVQFSRRLVGVGLSAV